MDETVFIATVLAVLLADAGPSRAVLVNCSLKELECDWVQARQRGRWAAADSIQEREVRGGQIGQQGIDMLV